MLIQTHTKSTTYSSLLPLLFHFYSIHLIPFICPNLSKWTIFSYELIDQTLFLQAHTNFLNPTSSIKVYSYKLMRTHLIHYSFFHLIFFISFHSILSISSYPLLIYLFHPINCFFLYLNSFISSCSYLSCSHLVN